MLFGISNLGLRRCALLLVLVTSTLSGSAFAQNDEDETGQVSGRVADLSGAGQSIVDQYSGAFTHNIPIQLPAFRGLEPKLSLNYSSATRNGLVGYGWSLGGLSTIQRVSPGRGAPRYDANDIYLLDGAELLRCKIGSTSPSCTTTCPVGSTCYSTKIESYRRLAMDASGNWTVWSKDGTRAIYSTAVLAVGKASKWLLTRVQDTRGNTVEYSYNDYLGSSTGNTWKYLSRISYNGASVDFYLEPRSDKQSMALGGAVELMAFRLKHIDVKVGGIRTRTYSLTYTESSVSGISMLSSVEQRGKSATLSGTAATSTSPASYIANGAVISAGTSRFHWSEGKDLAEGNYATSQLFAKYYNQNQDPPPASDCSNWITIESAVAKIFKTFAVQVGDFNGDGKGDVLCRYPGTSRIVVKLSLPERGDFSLPAFKIDWCGRGDIKVGDFNGDGRSDLICKRWDDTRKLIRLSNGVDGFDAEIDIGAWCLTAPKIADFDGDGKTDLLCRANSALDVRLSNGSSFANPISNGTWCSTRFRLADFNGDGRTDLYCQNAAYRNLVRLGDGVGGFAATAVDSGVWCIDGGKIYVSDFNGDGKDDLLCHASNDSNHVRLGDGSGGFEPGINSGVYCTNTLIIGDFNGDGWSDIACSSTLGGSLRIGNGSGGFNEKIVTGVKHARLAVDFGGDGVSDYLTYQELGGSGSIDEWSTSQGAVINNGIYGFPLIVTVWNGNGGYLSANYTSSSEWTNSYLPFSLKTVSSVVVGDSRNAVQISTYRYSGGLYDPVERRFLGFHQVTETRPCHVAPVNGACPTPTTIATTYQQDYGSISKPTRVDRSAGSALMSSSQYVYVLGGGGDVPYTSLLTTRWEYVYDGVGTACPSANCKRTSTVYAYDSYGNLTGQLEYGDYDTAGDELYTVTGYVPNTDKYIVGLPAVVTQFDPSVYPNKLLGRSVYIYDQPGANLPADLYAALAKAPVVGNRTHALRYLDTNNSYVVSSATYDAWGNTLTMKDEVGNTKSAAYDTTYHLYPTQITNALGHVTTQSFDAQCGVPVRVTGPNGSADVTTTTLDDYCRPVRVDAPLGGFVATSYCSASSTTNQCGMTRYTNAQFVKTEGPSPNGGSNLWKKEYYDGLGRTYRTEEVGPGASNMLTDVTFNERGLPTVSSQAYYSGTAPGNMTTAFDESDRPKTITRPDGKRSTIAYRLWTTTTTDALGRATSVTTDAYGRKVDESFRLDGVEYHTRYQYDRVGNLVGMTDAEGNQWTWTYDTLGNRSASRDPDRGTWTYAYYANGQLRSVTDAKVQTTVLTYDALNRKVSEVTGAGLVNKAWKYDESRAGYYNAGRLTSMSDATGSARYDYDLAGRRVKYVKMIDASVYTFEYGYDAAGRLKWTKYPDGDTAGTSASPVQYDNAGRLYAIPGVIADVTYKAWGGHERVGYTNGVSTTYGYDANHLVNQIRTTKVSDLQLLTYGRDYSGRITSVASGATAGESWTYAYDEINQLKSATNVGNAADSQTFTYSPTGNIRTNSRLSGTYAYPAPGAMSVRPHAVTNAGGVAYGYDANGNMTSKGGVAYGWDAANRLVSVGGTTFGYDANNERVKKVSSGVVTHYPQPDYRVQAGVVTKSISLGSATVATRKGTTTHWLHGDHLGSTRLMTDIAGNVVQRMNHRPFGERFGATGTVEQEVDFLGERRDAETGLVYQRSRYFDPVLARYTAADSSDPVKLSVGPNRYAFALNDPINKLDNGNEAYDVATASLSIIDNAYYGARSVAVGIYKPEATVRFNEFIDATGLRYPFGSLSAQRLPGDLGYYDYALPFAGFSQRGVQTAAVREISFGLFLRDNLNERPYLAIGVGFASKVVTGLNDLADTISIGTSIYHDVLVVAAGKPEYATATASAFSDIAFGNIGRGLGARTGISLASSCPNPWCKAAGAAMGAVSGGILGENVDSLAQLGFGLPDPMSYSGAYAPIQYEPSFSTFSVQNNFSFYLDNYVSSLF